MKISLSGAGKRFNREWIFRNASLDFLPNTFYAITGPNGSGKSTLLQAIGGILGLSEGAISYYNNAVALSMEKAYQQISFCAPYLEVIEEMTLLEFLDFHARFKTFLPGINKEQVISIVGLEASATKQIRNYSSGMKQRVKLAQAIFSNTPVVLLDEPCSNLDATGIELYHSLISRYCQNRVVIISSNDEQEFHFVSNRISIQDLKLSIGAARL